MNFIGQLLEEGISGVLYNVLEEMGEIVLVLEDLNDLIPILCKNLLRFANDGTEAADYIDSGLPIELEELLEPKNQDMQDVVTVEQVLEAGEVKMRHHGVDAVEGFDSVFLGRGRRTVMVCWSSSMTILKTGCS